MKIGLLIKKIGLKRIFGIVCGELVRPCIPFVYKLKWIFCENREAYKGISEVSYDSQLIISLTSYPKRINEIHLTIKSLLMQKMKANKVILWLAHEQFPNSEKDLPLELINLKKYGLEIQWCDDYKSYKKLVPTLRMFPDAIIITVDDDMYYHPKMVQRLYNEYKKNKKVIHCHRATKYVWENEKLVTIPGGYDTYSQPSYKHKLTGCSGVLYPPHSLHPDVIKTDLFMRLAPTNDDLWFWLMGVMNNTKIKVIENNLATLWFVGKSQEDALNYVNDMGENLLVKQRENIFEFYPGLMEKIIKD